ncbi:hypothetical protein EhV18_00452 [Emiliania huxleyi virus 18]|nr:hypothetical protein EhV18_00452 [Emiliania huxleyi virus 18]AHA55538.1 hypothetical protein EhV156_00443 [Emiliania huxleyi virus 156]
MLFVSLFTLTDLCSNDIYQNGVFTSTLSSSDVSASNKLLHDITNMLHRCNIDYIIDGGTLVGSLLHHGNIPWDDDIDILISLSQLKRLFKCTDNLPFKMFSAEKGAYYKVWDTRNPHVDNHRIWGFPFIDIGILSENSTHTWELRSLNKKYKQHIYNKSWLYPHVKRMYDNIIVSAPRDGFSMLNHRMGKSWHTKCVHVNWNHKLERKIWKNCPTIQSITSNCDNLSIAHVKRIQINSSHIYEHLIDPTNTVIHTHLYINNSFQY